MTWEYRLGKKKEGEEVCYYIYEYIMDEEIGDGWTEDPIVTNCYESKEDAIEDLLLMVEDIKRTKPFDYE
jgi:hypothetical protein